MLDRLINNMKKNSIWIKENKNREFYLGYMKGLKDVIWFKDKVDGETEKEIKEYFNAPDKDNYFYKRLQEMKFKRGY